MTYIEMLQKARESTSENAKHQKQQLKVLFFRRLGFYITPFFLMMNVSANKITFLGLFIGIVASLLIWTGNVFIGIVAYFFVVLLDHVDGTVARVRGEATFFGRFIDGYFDIVVDSCIRLAISALIAGTYGISWIVWLGIVSTILIPMHFLFYDRYSAFSRWINEEHPQVKIKPYLRGEKPMYFNIVEDVQILLLFCLPLYFYSATYSYVLLSIYFILNIYMAIYTLYTYTLSAYKNFIISAKPHR